ncbi:MAG: hypothetical protein ACRDRW_07990 [Pseudonocardiaceae bacterium]
MTHPQAAASTTPPACPHPTATSPTNPATHLGGPRRSLIRFGADTATIATALGIDIDAVGPLLRVAEAKLARLLTPEESPHQDDVNRPPSATTPSV